MVQKLIKRQEEFLGFFWFNNLRPHRKDVSFPVYEQAPV
jgi:hypothetical protein